MDRMNFYTSPADGGIFPVPPYSAWVYIYFSFQSEIIILINDDLGSNIFWSFSEDFSTFPSGWPLGYPITEGNLLASESIVMNKKSGYIALSGGSGGEPYRLIVWRNV